MFVVREKWVDTRTDCYIDRSSSLEHSSTSSSSWLGVAQPGVTKGPKPSVFSWFLLRHPVSNWLGHLVILFSKFHLLPLFFRLFTLVHLLIDGSVESQYITMRLRIHWLYNVNKKNNVRHPTLKKLFPRYDVRLHLELRLQFLSSDDCRTAIHSHCSKDYFDLKRHKLLIWAWNLQLACLE